MSRTSLQGIHALEHGRAAILEQLENSALTQFMQDSLWAYPIVLSAHALGMAVFAGLTVMASIRLLGVADAVPRESLRVIVKIGLCGLLVNFVSGFLLFAMDASAFLAKWPFRVKLLLIIAGVCTVGLVYRQLDRSESPAVAGRDATTVPIAAIGIWTAVVISGRLIAYSE